MKRPISLCGFAAWSPMLDDTALGEEVVSREMAAPKLELRGVEVRSDGSVTGVIVNGADVPTKDVKLLVSHVWSWTHDRHPGEDNPNRTSHVRIAGEIAANGSVPFFYSPYPALQMPADGKCQTTAAVQSFIEIGNCPEDPLSGPAESSRQCLRASGTESPCANRPLFFAKRSILIARLQ